MIRLILDLGKHYTIGRIPGGSTDITFTTEGQAVMAAHGVLKGDDCPPFRMTQAGQDMLVVQVFAWSEDPAVQDAVRLVKVKNVMDAAKCFGYYGFGTGFLKGKMDQAIVGHGFPTPIFCADSCQVGVECCQHHRLRCDNLGLDSDQASVDNAIDGEAVAGGRDPRDRAEATLSWPLKIIQSVIRAN